MKKIIALFLILCLFVSLVACSSKIEIVETVDSEHEMNATTISENVVSFYPGTTIPTVDSVLDVSIVDYDENPIYGTFDTEEEVKTNLLAYVALLSETYGYESDFMEDSGKVAFEIDTDDGTMIVVAWHLADVGYVIAVGLP